MSFSDDIYKKVELGGEAADGIFTKLSDDISPTATEINVVSTSGFPDGTSGFAFISLGNPFAATPNNETIKYDSITPSSFICSASGRGYGGTTAIEHSSEDLVRLELNATIWNRMCETVANLQELVGKKGGDALNYRADVDGISAYDVVCFNGTDVFTVADASFRETSFVVGIAPKVIAPNAYGSVQTGIIYNSSWSWTKQIGLWLSDTAGEMIQTQTATVLCPVGYAITPQLIYFRIPAYNDIIIA